MYVYQAYLQSIYPSISNLDRQSASVGVVYQVYEYF